MKCDKNKIAIYICIKSLEEDLEFINLLRAISGSIRIHPSATRPTKGELCEIVKDYDIVICGIQEKFDLNVAECIQRLKVIASLSTGVDHIDVHAFEVRNIKIINVPHSNNISVAEHTWAMIFALSKKLFEADAAVRSGEERGGIKERPMELYGKTIGIVGAGSIAYHVAQIACILGCSIKIWTFHPERHNEFKSLRATLVPSLEELIMRCDVLTIHLPLTSMSRNLIRKEHLLNVQRPLILVNTSRAEIIEKGALVESLEKKDMLRCGLDVYYDDELTKYPAYKVILSPHIAGLSQESTKRMHRDLVQRLTDLTANLL
ncbi:MAG TPA: NAD(P)-dependent oxidoreductase [Pyrinomonadaceae bacterium]|jgi:D-3-phosphoglycerate dehydrogenase